MARLADRRWKVLVDNIQFTGLDVAFEVEKSIKPEPNKCSLKIWNMTEAHRKQLEALTVRVPPKATGAAPAKESHVKGRIRVELWAGYKETGTQMIFRGDLRRASTALDASEYVTSLEGEDGGRSVLWSRVNQSFPPGSTWTAVAKACANAMGVGFGNLDDVARSTPFVFSEGTILSGSAADELAHLFRSVGFQFSVQNGVIQAVQRGKAIQSTAVKLGQRSGLVGIPEINADGTVAATMLMIPDVYPGRLVVFDTANVQGAYRVERAKYTGDTHGDSWYIQAEFKVLKNA